MIRLLLLMSILFAQEIAAQNLVADPGFEKLRYCPGGISMLNVSKHWYSPSAGTPDIFNKCNGRGTQVSVPRNICGKQTPFEGNGYAGLILYEPDYYDYKEYIRTSLLQYLKKDAEYELAIMISLADNSSYAVQDIQAAFTSTSASSLKYTSLEIQPDLTLRGNDEYLTDKKKWMKLKGVYKAKGNERYLTIGNFTPAKYGKPRLINKNGDIPSAYYFIDAVSFTLIKDAPSSPNEESEVQQETDSIIEGRTFILKNILFETDKDVLLPQSIEELKKLKQILLDLPTLEIEIIGHTDNRATFKHNADLSERRAKAVVNFLVSEGIEKARLSYSGKGEAEPVATNETEEGRALNRRVEFRVMKR